MRFGRCPLSSQRPRQLQRRLQSTRAAAAAPLRQARCLRRLPPTTQPTKVPASQQSRRERAPRQASRQPLGDKPLNGQRAVMIRPTDFFDLIHLRNCIVLLFVYFLRLSFILICSQLYFFNTAKSWTEQYRCINLTFSRFYNLNSVFIY